MLFAELYQRLEDTSVLPSMKAALQGLHIDGADAVIAFEVLLQGRQRRQRASDSGAVIVMVIRYIGLPGAELAEIHFNG